MENMQPNGLETPSNTNTSVANQVADAIFDDNVAVPIVEPGATLNQQPNQGEQLQEQMIDMDIDSRYAHLNKEEALIRTLQSKYDSTSSQLEKVKPMIEQAEILRNFVNDLMSDEQTLYAFLNEVKPELAKPLQGNFESYAKKKLTEEFGEGFEPDQDLARRGDPNHFRYFKRMEELYNEFSQGSSKRASTIKELRESRKQQEELIRQQQMQELNALKQKFNVDETQIQRFTTWAQSLKAETLFEIFRSMSRIPNLPQTATLTGQTVSPNKIDEILDFLK